MNLPYFNEVNAAEPEDYYQVNTELDGKPLQLDLNIESFSIKETELAPVAGFLQDLPNTVARITAMIQDDFVNGEAVKEYLKFHLDEIPDEQLKSLLAASDSSLPREEQLLSVLRLKRIGFYPEDESNYAIFDFTANEELSQYLLVVKIKKDGKLDHITMES